MKIKKANIKKYYFYITPRLIKNKYFKLFINNIHSFPYNIYQRYYFLPLI